MTTVSFPLIFAYTAWPLASIKIPRLASLVSLAPVPIWYLTTSHKYRGYLLATD
jgi:hypothetical protein